MSELAQKLIKENLRTKNPVLDLGNCGLCGTEDQLFAPLAEAYHLDTLILANEWEEYLPKKHNFKKYNSANRRPYLKNHLIQVPIHLPSQLKKLVIGNTQAWNSELYEEAWKKMEGDRPNDQEDGLFPLANAKALRQLTQLEFLFLSDGYLCNYLNGGEWLKDLKQLRYLHFVNSGFGDAEVETLQHLTQLEYLDISNHQATSLSCLRQMPKLKVLVAKDGKLQDIDSLGVLQQLEYVALDDNAIQDISPLGELANLKVLNISCNKIDSIKPLTKLEQLRKLDIYGCELKSSAYAVLKKMPQIENLTIGGDIPVRSFAFLKYLPRLRSLDFSFSKLKSAHFLSYIRQIEYLDLSENEIKHLVLEDLPRLKKIDISGNPLRSLYIKGLPRLKEVETPGFEEGEKLKSVYIEDLPVMKILDLGALTRLKELHLSNVPLLEKLSLDFTHQLCDHQLLNQFSRLKELDLSHSKCETLYLENLAYLEKLHMNMASCKNVILKGLPKLKKVEVPDWDTKVKVMHITGLSALKTLDLSLCFYLKELHLTDLPQLQELNLNDVPGIRDYSFLNQFSQLKRLYLSRARGKHLPLKNLSHLQKLQLDSSEFKSIHLHSLHQLKKLNIDNMMTSGKEGVYIEDMPQLESIYIERSKLKQLHVIQSPRLENITADWCYNLHTVTLEALPQLTTASFNFNKIRNLLVATPLPQLQELGLVGNPLKSFAWVTQTTALQSLNISYVQKLINLKAVTTLKHLTHLNCAFCNLATIQHLLLFPHLESLVLDISLTQDIDTLQKLPQLKTLEIKPPLDKAPPIWYVRFKGHKRPLSNFVNVTPLPYVDKIWALLKTEEEANWQLAEQLALGQGWSKKDFKVYKKLSFRSV